MRVFAARSQGLLKALVCTPPFWSASENNDCSNSLRDSSSRRTTMPHAFSVQHHLSRLKTFEFLSQLRPKIPMVISFISDRGAGALARSDRSALYASRG